jgi:hypothetical protein
MAVNDEGFREVLAKGQLFTRKPSFLRIVIDANDNSYESRSELIERGLSVRKYFL